MSTERRKKEKKNKKDKHQPVKRKKEKRKGRKNKSCIKQLITEVQAGGIILQRNRKSLNHLWLMQEGNTKAVL